MNRNILNFVSVLLFALVPIPASAQCKDQLCMNLQGILGAAEIDFRGYAHRTSTPDVSTNGTKVPCQMSAWANNVPMYICYAQVPYADGADWYAKTLEDLKSLSPDWHFDIKSPGEDHYVNAGPPDCEVPPTEGPYIGQCPLHLRLTKQGDGTAKVYLYVNSLTSPFLLHHVVAPAAKPATAPVVTAIGCDEFCQNLKKAFEARSNAFEELRAAKTGDDPPGITLKLSGAKECAVNAPRGSHSAEAGTQFVCYWQESSASTAEARFRDLVARFEVLVPSTWATHQEEEPEESSGTNSTAWSAVEPGGKHDVRIYVSRESVGLHITAWQ